MYDFYPCRGKDLMYEILNDNVLLLDPESKYLTPDNQFVYESYPRVKQASYFHQKESYTFKKQIKLEIHKIYAYEVSINLKSG